jgi:hypothetical protein
MPSLRHAINQQCKQCVYDPGAGGTWREQVANCQGYSCPLYAVRLLPVRREPVMSEGITHSRQKAAEKLCQEP